MNPGDLTQLDTAKQWLGLSGLAIAAISQANPCQITLATRPNTPLLSGGSYSIDGVNGMTELNGNAYVITTIDPLNFSIPVDSTGFTAYAGSGFVGVSDPLVARLISAVSTYMQQWMNRTIANKTYAEQRDGQGMMQMLALNFPITAIHSLTVDGISIPARAPMAPTVTTMNPGGYVFDDLRVMLSGWYSFCRGYQNIALNYDAGLMISDEAQAIPAAPPYVLSTLARWSAGDRGVVYASSGVALTAVAGAPNPGEYSVAGSAYTFNAADAGVGVLISYAYIPFDLEQAAVDMIGDWFVYRTRIGRTSEAIEGQSITFVNVPIPARAQGVMNQYRRVTPVV